MLKNKSFKSAWITDRHEISVIDKQFSKLKSSEVLVKVKACGICGTDIHYFKDYPEGKPLPVGHEIAGIIEEKGSEVIDFQIGDSVTVQNHIACGRCTNCLNQKPQACTGIITYMEDRAAMAEYLRVPAGMAVKYDGLSFAEAALAEPLTVSLDLWREADITLGDNILIIGPGIIGLGLIKLAKLSGAANVVIAGRNLETVRGETRQKASKALGAELCVETADKTWKKSLKKLYPSGFNKVIVTAPPQLIPDAVELTGFGGDIIYNGINFKNDSLMLSANELHFQKKHLKTSHAIPNWGFPIALDLLKSKSIDPELLLTHKYKFSDIHEAFMTAQAADKPVIKVVVDF